MILILKMRDQDAMDSHGRLESKLDINRRNRRIYRSREGNVECANPITLG